jgi:hypothetical protein
MQRLNIQRRMLAESLFFNERLAREGKASSERLSELAEQEEELEKINNGMLVLELLKLQGQAAGLGLFVDWGRPSLDGLGKDDAIRDSIRKEMSELKLAIRKERYERAQLWEIWLKLPVSFLAALTGLIGAAIGIITILRH